MHAPVLAPRTPADSGSQSLSESTTSAQTIAFGIFASLAAMAAIYISALSFITRSRSMHLVETVHSLAQKSIYTVAEGSMRLFPASLPRSRFLNSYFPPFHTRSNCAIASEADTVRSFALMADRSDTQNF